jgi:hypothetical protein
MPCGTSERTRHERDQGQASTPGAAGHCLAALIGAGLLAAWALSKQASYFYVPSDLVAHPPEQGRAVRLGGMVQRGSIKTMPDGVTITFVVGDGKATVPVRYAGSRPTSSWKDRAWSPKAAWKDHVRGRQPSGQA